MKICVACNRGPRGEETPWAFYVGGRRLRVVEVLDRWTDAVDRYFEVSVDDGRRFVLRLHATPRVWELVAVFAARRHAAPKPVTPAAPRKFFSALLARSTPKATR